MTHRLFFSRKEKFQCITVFTCFVFSLTTTFELGNHFYYVRKNKAMVSSLLCLQVLLFNLYRCMYHRKLFTSLATHEPLNSFGLGASIHELACMVINPFTRATFNLTSFALNSSISAHIATIMTSKDSSRCWSSFLRVSSNSCQSSPMLTLSSCIFLSGLYSIDGLGQVID